MSEASVGFIGLGDVGHPMASRLTDLANGLTVFDVDPGKAATLVARGARMASSVSHVAELCDVICVRVAGDDRLVAVVGELLTQAREGTTVLVHSSVHPETLVQVARDAAASGVHVLDVAVVGPPSVAEQGRLVLLVGGSPDRLEAVRPLLDRMGDLVLHLGDVGAGARAKLARTLLQYVAFAAAGEAARLAEACGIPPAVLGHVVRHADAVMGGPGAVLWRDTTAPITADDPWYDVLDRVRTVGERELRLALEAAEQLGVPTPFANMALGQLAPSLGFPERG